MTQVLLIIHLLVTVVMIGLILLQRSEGGGLGVGGGSGGLGGLATPRGTANALTKATMTCFALFVILSLILAVMAGGQGTATSLIDQIPAAAVQGEAAEPLNSNDQPMVPVPE